VNLLTSILRTVVPALWGSFIGWLLTLLPLLEPHRAELLAYGELAVPLVTALLIGLWYAFWRWLEPKLPDWLTRILLGSAKVPVYVAPVIVDKPEHRATTDGPIPGEAPQ
jgi:hypothetical protein